MAVPVVFSALLALLALRAVDGHASFVGSMCPFAEARGSLGGQRRSMLQTGDMDPEGGDPPIGACKYTNVFSRLPECSAYLGAAWDDASALSDCARQGGEFAAGEGCDREDFAGVCATSSPGDARKNVYIYATAEPSDPAADQRPDDCAMFRTACVTFARGDWSSEGGLCDPGPADQRPKPERPSRPSGRPGGGRPGPKAAADDDNPRPCLAMRGAAGGGHMTKKGRWDESCPVTQRGGVAPGTPQASFPLQFTADIKTIRLEQGPAERRGKDWYDFTRNAHRKDVWQVEGGGVATDPSGKPEPRNYTLLIEKAVLTTIDWDAQTCVKQRLPVGNIRPNFHLDSIGAGTKSEYLGRSYLYHDGDFKLARQWRKVEPIENAYVIVAFSAARDDEVDPEAPIPLMMQTPGQPGTGDTVREWSNHSIVGVGNLTYDDVFPPGTFSPPPGMNCTFSGDDTDTAGEALAALGDAIANHTSGLDVEDIPKGLKGGRFKGRGGGGPRKSLPKNLPTTPSAPTAPTPTATEGSAAAALREAAAAEGFAEGETETEDAETEDDAQEGEAASDDDEDEEDEAEEPDEDDTPKGPKGPLVKGKAGNPKSGVRVAWRVNEAKGLLLVKMTAKIPGDGWFAVAVRDSDECQMSPADVVAVEVKDGVPSPLKTLRAEGYGAPLPAADHTLTNAGVEAVAESGLVTATFTRPLAELAYAAGEGGARKAVPLNWARGPTPTMNYHGPSKACVAPE